MPFRVFISYRTSDGADKATALARDLDALFGQGQIFLDKEDLPAGSRWRDEIASTLHGSPILLVLVTPHYLGARDSAGGLCIAHADDPVRAELEAAVATNAYIIPLLCDGVEQTPAATDLPAPFDQLAARTWRRLRAYDWREDLARLADDLRGHGIVPRVAPTGAEAEAKAEAQSGPDTVPFALADEVAAAAPPPGASTGRRVILGGAAIILLGGGVFATWRWQRLRAANLSGRWRAQIGARGATSFKGAQLVYFSLEHQGRLVRIASSAVNIEHDQDWENYRDFWKEQHGAELKRVLYRGDGEVRDEDEDAPEERAASGAAAAAVGLRRLAVAVRIEVPGGDEPIDTGALNVTVDADDRRMRGRLWLNSEQAERVVDLRRE